MKNRIVIIVRYLLGIVFLFNGINMFAQFMPLPSPEQPELAQEFLNILHRTGYFYPILGLVKLVTAASLFTNRYLALMLIVMFPITLNGILFHAFMDQMMLPMALFIGVLHIYLIYNNREKYMPMVK